jgi:hypothetical protein
MATVNRIGEILREDGYRFTFYNAKADSSVTVCIIWKDGRLVARGLAIKSVEEPEERRVMAKEIAIGRAVNALWNRVNGPQIRFRAKMTEKNLRINQHLWEVRGLGYKRKSEYMPEIVAGESPFVMGVEPKGNGDQT